MRLEEKRVGKTTVTESHGNVNPIRAAGPPAQAMKPATAGLCRDHGVLGSYTSTAGYAVFDGRAGVPIQSCFTRGFRVPSVDQLME
jgi:hypothetical protein